MGQRPSGATRLQPGNGCRRQQNSTDYLGRAADRRTLSRRCLKLTTDCEATEKWIALIEPTREEPEYYRGLPGLPAVEVRVCGFPIWALRQKPVTPDRCLPRIRETIHRSLAMGEPSIDVTSLTPIERIASATFWP